MSAITDLVVNVKVDFTNFPLPILIFTAHIFVLLLYYAIKKLMDIMEKSKQIDRRHCIPMKIVPPPAASNSIVDPAPPALAARDSGRVSRDHAPADLHGRSLIADIGLRCCWIVDVGHSQTILYTVNNKADTDIIYHHHHHLEIL